MAIDATGRTLRARLAAHSMHAQHDSAAITATMRAGLATKYERLVDPDGVLPPEERARRAKHAKKADYARRAYLQHQQARDAQESADTRDLAANAETTNGEVQA